MDNYVPVQGVAQYLGVSRNTVHVLVKRGILPCGVKLGRSRRWKLSDIERAVEGIGQVQGERLGA